MSTQLLASPGQPPAQTQPDMSQLIAIVQQQQAEIQRLMQASQQPPPQTQMTPEQFAQATKAFNFNPTWLDQLFGEATTPQLRQAALSEFANAILQNAFEVSRYQALGHAEDLYKHISPQLQQVSGLDERFFYEDLYKGHEHLQPYDPFVRQMVPHYRQNPQFPSQREQQIEYVRQQLLSMVPGQQQPQQPVGQQPQRPIAQPYHPQPTQQQVQQPATFNGQHLPPRSVTPVSSSPVMSNGGGSAAAAGTGQQQEHRPSFGFHTAAEAEAARKAAGISPL